MFRHDPGWCVGAHNPGQVVASHSQIGTRRGTWSKRVEATTAWGLGHDTGGDTFFAALPHSSHVTEIAPHGTPVDLPSPSNKPHPPKASLLASVIASLINAVTGRQ